MPGPLPEATDEYLFSGGLRESEDHWLQAEGMARLENSFQERDGALSKLPGYAALSATRSLGETSVLGIYNEMSGPQKLVTRGGLFGAVVNGYLWSRTDRWLWSGRVSPWAVDARTVTEVDKFNYLDCCRSGDWLFTAYQYTDEALAVDTIRLILTHLPTGQSVLKFRLFTASMARPRLIQWDNAGNVALVYEDGVNLRYRKMGPYSVGAELTLEASIGSIIWDVCSDVTGGYWWLAFMDGVGFVQLRRGEIQAASLTAGVIDVSTIAAYPNHRAVCITANHAQDAVAIAWSVYDDVGGGLLRARVYRAVTPSDLVGFTHAAAVLYERPNTFAAPTPANAGDDIRWLGVCRVDSLGWYFVLHDPLPPITVGGGSTSDYEPLTVTLYLQADGTLISQWNCPRVHPRTRPAWDGKRGFFLCEHKVGDVLTGTDPNSYHVVLGGDLLGGANPLVVYGFWGYTNTPQSEFHPSSTSQLSRASTPYQDAAGNWHLQAFDGIQHENGVALRARIRDYALCADDRVGQSVEFGAQTYVGGALLTAWDGVRVVEAGFLNDPYIRGSAQYADTLAAGTRSYKLTFMRISSSGEVIRSRPSESVEFTNTAAQGNLVKWYPLGPTLQNSLGSERAGHFVEIWRTKDGEAAPFYLVDRVFVPGYLTAATSYQDDTEDVDLTPELLYTDGAEGSELANDPPISANSLCLWRSRLWITDGEQVQYSKESAIARAAEFSGFQTLPQTLPQAITAVGPLGDMLAVFSADATGYVYGDGPASNGTASTLLGPVQVSGEIGCTQPAGLLPIPGGLLVPTRRGIQLLSNAREYSQIGAGIERTLETYPRIRDADMQVGSDLAWFVLSESDASSGLLAYLDTRANTWGLSTLATETPSSVRSVGSDQFVGLEDGSALELTPAVYSVGGEFRGQAVLTPWFKPGGLNGEIRVRRLWLLGEKRGSSGLRLSIGYNFEEAWHSVLTLTDAQLEGMEGMDDRLVIRVPVPRQRCTSFRLLLEELIHESVEDTAGFRLVALRMHTALRPQRGALLATANAGGGFT